MRTKNPFRYFKTSPEVIRLAVMMYVRFPLSLRNVEDLLHERGIDISHETGSHSSDSTAILAHGEFAALESEDEALARRVLFELVAARDAAKTNAQIVPISAARKG